MASVNTRSVGSAANEGSAHTDTDRSKVPATSTSSSESPAVVSLLAGGNSTPIISTTISPTISASNAAPAIASSLASPSTATVTASFSSSSTSTNLASALAGTTASTGTFSSSSALAGTTVSTGTFSLPSATTPVDDMPYSSGDLAGGIVGAAVGAAILTFMITFFLTGRRGLGKRQSSDGLPSSAFGDPSQEKMTPVAMPVGSYEAFLPQSADDRTMQSRVQILLDQIELHIDNFYQKTRFQPTGVLKERLSLIDSGKLPQSLVETMGDPAVQMAAIKHTLAHELTSSMSPSPQVEDSLLPSNLSVLPAIDRLSESGKSGAVQQAYSRWKLLNAYLYPTLDGETAFQERRDQVATKIANSFAVAFKPWQSDGIDSVRSQHNIIKIAQTASQVGVLIMSQPSSFEFRWTPSMRGKDDARTPTVALPAFVKTTDVHGRSLPKAQTLIKPVLQ